MDLTQSAPPELIQAATGPLHPVRLPWLARRPKLFAASVLALGLTGGILGMGIYSAVQDYLKTRAITYEIVGLINAGRITVTPAPLPAAPPAK